MTAFPTRNLSKETPVGNLVLKRTLWESIVLTIPPTDSPIQVRVQVAKIEPGAVKLAFIAPLHVRILREELETSHASVDRPRL